jgi:hypothetical protein
MSKNLLIPVFVFTIAALGCNSSSNDTTDGGAGKTGSAGAMGGSGGSTEGSGGGGAGAAGSDAGGASSDAGAAGSDGGLIPPSCPLDVWSPTMFCTILLGFCGPATPGYTTMAECMTTYAAVGAATPNKQLCESQHLCNAANDTGADRTLHCSHAVGLGDQCTQTN